MRLRDVLPIWRIERFLQRRHDRIRPITSEMLECNLRAARRHAVVSDCHPRDMVYQGVIRHRNFKTIASAIDYYFDDGARSADKVSKLVAGLISKPQPLDVLEFAAGYGMVTRHLKKNSALSLVSCDIHEEAVAFLAQAIGVRSILSAHAPEELRIGDQFDVVFALSFFSHMPRSTFGRWINTLYARLRSQGALIFTTHGMASRQHFGAPEIPADGFWFFPGQSDQHDLSTAEYGSTIVTEDFVRREVLAQTGEAVRCFQQAAWWDHQDLYVVIRP